MTSPPPKLEAKVSLRRKCQTRQMRSHCPSCSCFLSCALMVSICFLAIVLGSLGKFAAVYHSLPMFAHSVWCCFGALPLTVYLQDYYNDTLWHVASSSIIIIALGSNRIWHTLTQWLYELDNSSTKEHRLCEVTSCACRAASVGMKRTGWCCRHAAFVAMHRGCFRVDSDMLMCVLITVNYRILFLSAEQIAMVIASGIKMQSQHATSRFAIYIYIFTVHYTYFFVRI